jgi:heme oxygenase-like protein
MSATVDAAPSAHPAPPLPAPRGPVSSAVLAALRAGAVRAGAVRAGAHPDVEPAISVADPYRDDIQLALYCLYELHYRGFAEVAEELEWEPALLAVRRALERSFLAALRRDVPPGTDVQAEIAELLTEPADVDGRGVSHHLMRDGTLWQLREYLALRSLYHLKEADPQAWVIPRLHGAAKAALVTVEHDEYGAGDPERMHAELFARMLRALDVDDTYGAQLDAAPAEALAEVNFMSMCGLHRQLRGALVGQFVTVELTSSPGSDRLVRAMRRLGLGPDAIDFYAEHVEADAVHEQVVRRGVLAPLLAAEPELAADVVFGIRASVLLAEHLESRLLRRWSTGQTSLRRQLPG